MSRLQASYGCWSSFTRSTKISTSLWTNSALIHITHNPIACLNRTILTACRPTCTHALHILRLSELHKMNHLLCRFTRKCGSRDTAVMVASRLQDGGPRNRGSILDRRKRFISTPKRTDWFRAPRCLLLFGYWGLSSRGKGNRGRKLTTHLTQCRAIPQFIPSWNAQRELYCVLP
jgi:hypothetical protein